jgi:site-specific DNA recombinase
MQVVIYARLSKNKSKLSKKIDLQISIAKKYAATQGWEVVLVFVDDDISASRFGKKIREDYGNLLEYVKHNPVDIILVTEMPRLYRQVEEVLVLTSMAERGEIKLKIVATEGDEYDLTTPEGIHRAIGAVNNAKLEAEKTSKRTKRLAGERASLGLPHSGRRCFAYEADGMTVREAESYYWVRAQDLIIDEHKPLQVVEQKLFDEGMRTTGGLRVGRRNLKKWLKNKRYAGIRVHNGVEYPAVWPALTTPERFEQLQIALKAGDKRRELRGQPRSHPLSGYAKCGLCGNRLTGAMRCGGNGREKKPAYYCHPDHEHGGCGKIQRAAAPLEHLVKEAILFRLDTVDLYNLMADTEQDSSRLKELINRQQTEQQKLDGLIGDYYGKNPDGLSRQQFMLAKSTAERVISETERELDRLTSSQSVSVMPTSETVRKAWDEGDVAMQHQITGLLIEEIRVHPLGKTRPRYEEWTAFDPEKIEIIWRV